MFIIFAVFFGCVISPLYFIDKLHFFIFIIIMIIIIIGSRRQRRSVASTWNVHDWKP